MNQPKKKFILKDDNVVEMAEPETEINTDYTNIALGVCRVDNQWVVTKIPYNPKTNQTGPIEFIKDDGTRYASEVKFKVETIHQIFAPNARNS